MEHGGRKRKAETMVKAELAEEDFCKKRCPPRADVSSSAADAGASAPASFPMAAGGSEQSQRFTRIKNAVERECWPCEKAPDTPIALFANDLEDNVIANATRNVISLTVNRVFLSLEHNNDERSATAFILAAAKASIWTQWVKEKKWTLGAAMRMPHGRLGRIDETRFKKVRVPCQPQRDARVSDRFKCDMRKIENFSTVAEFQAGLRSAACDLKTMHGRSLPETFAQAEHERILEIATGVIFTSAISDRSGEWLAASTKKTRRASNYQSQMITLSLRNTRTAGAANFWSRSTCSLQRPRCRGSFWNVRGLSRSCSAGTQTSCHRMYLNAERTTTTSQLLRKFFETTAPVDNAQPMKKVFANDLNHVHILAGRCTISKIAKPWLTKPRFCTVCLPSFVKWGEEPIEQAQWQSPSQSDNADMLQFVGVCDASEVVASVSDSESAIDDMSETFGEVAEAGDSAASGSVDAAATASLGQLVLLRRGLRLWRPARPRNL